MRSLALVLALCVATGLAAVPAQAASCNGASHDITLTDGTASPGSGTTSTAIRFAVTYADSGGCAPTSVTVNVSGVGVLSLAGSGTSYSTGVTFSRALTLSAGQHTYSFSATSGSGGGVTTVTLTAVSPSAVVITVPTAQPTPRPTPPPTPRPNAPPTPPPTPSPTPTATPSLAPATTSGLTPTPTATAGLPSVLPRLTPTPPIGGAGSVPDDRAGTGPAPLGTALVRLVAAWGLLTIFGLLLFALLLRRIERRPGPGHAAPVDGPAVGPAGSAGLATPAAAAPAGPPATGPTAPAADPRRAAAPRQRTPGTSALFAASPVAPGVRDDEKNLPRWLRPSVQAARRGYHPPAGHETVRDE